MEIEKCNNGINFPCTEYIESLLVKHNLKNWKTLKTIVNEEGR